MTEITPKTKFTQKIGLVLLSIFVTAIILEIVLRLAGFVFLSLQENRNKFSLGQKPEYTIMCIGESTTGLGGEHSYPRQLEKILNEQQSDISFSVINKGIPSITTTNIYSNIEKYLKQYNPDIVVAMMGINDKEEPFIKRNPFILAISRLGDKIRVCKLIKLTIQHVSHRIFEYRVKKSDENLARIEKRLDQNPSSSEYTKLSRIYRISYKLDDQKRALQKAITTNPADYEAHFDLGIYYKRLGNYTTAIKEFARILTLNPPPMIKAAAYAFLAETYKLLEDYARSEKIYLELLRQFPTHPGAYGNLADVYLEQKLYDKAEIVLRKQLQVNPRSIDTYGKLAHCMRRKGNLAGAAALLQQAIKINPETAQLYNELGRTLLEARKYTEAEKVLAASLSLIEQDTGTLASETYALLLKTYTSQEKQREASDLEKKIARYHAEHNPQTFKNYKKIKKILDRYNVPLIAVQYPMRSIVPLKNMLIAFPDIIFVDNEDIFKRAVQESSYDEYFTDSFAGDFGHCTPKGNHLLANNVAQTLLKELASINTRK